MRRLLGGGKSRAKVANSEPGGGSSSGAGSSTDPGPRRSKRVTIDRKQAVDDAMDLFGGKLRGTAAVEEERAKEAAERILSKFMYGVRRGAEEEEKLAACMELATYVNGAFGFEASALGEHLRKSKALAFVLQLLYEGEAPLQRIGLMVLSNLVSDAFDPNSADTKHQVHHAGIFERIKDFVYSADGVAQTYACACLQNLCKDVRFARLMRSYELIEELERLVKVSPNEHLRKFAAGALFNAVEAIHRDFLASSLDARDYAEDVGPNGSSGTASDKKKAGSVLGQFFSEHPPEVELSEEVVDELAKRETLQSEEMRRREEAVALIQSLVRQKKTRRAFRMLMALAKAVSLVARVMRRRRRRKRRRAALLVQARFRAYICATRGICGFNTMLRLIICVRQAHQRALKRCVPSPNRPLPAPFVSIFICAKADRRAGVSCVPQDG